MGWDRLADDISFVSVAHGNVLNFFSSAMLRIVVKNYFDCYVGIKIESIVPKRRLLWRSGQEKMVSWATVVALGKGRKGQIRNSYERK